jgi:hypothetical protein
MDPHRPFHRDARPPRPRRRTECEQLLGDDHPFVAADAAFREAARRLLLTAVFVAALAAFAYPGRSAAVLAPGAFVLLYLALRVAVRGDEREELATELVLGGGETLPIGAVARLRRSLLGRRRDHACLALRRTLEQAAAQAAEHPAERRPAVLDVADQVIEIAELLQGTRSARAVAMTQRLLGTSAGWHLLAFEPDGLARELGRIRFLLRADEATRSAQFAEPGSPSGPPAAAHR